MLKFPSTFLPRENYNSHSEYKQDKKMNIQKQPAEYAEVVNGWEIVKTQELASCFHTMAHAYICRSML